MAKRPMKPEDLWALPRVGTPVPSPDGRHLCVPVTTYSLETNEGTARLWLVPSSARGAGRGGPGDPARPLTSAEFSSGQPAWSPDGSRIAFVRKPPETPPEKAGKGGPKHADRPQIYVLSLDGGDPERLTDLPLGAVDPRWFPDGRRLAFVAPVLGGAPTPAGTADLLRQREEDPVKAHVTEDRVYRFWDHWLTDGQVQHIFVLDTESGEMLDLIPDSKRWFDPMDPSGQYDISPEGDEIAFAACRSKPPYMKLRWGVFTVGVPARIGPKTRARRAVLVSRDHPADAFGPRYTPDGRKLLYGVQYDPHFYADRVRITACDRRTGKHRVLTEEWDRSASQWIFGDDPGTLFILAEDAGRSAVFALDLHAALRRPEANPPRRIGRGGTFCALRAAGGRLYTTMSTLTRPAEVVSMPSSGRSLRTHTAFTGPVLGGLELGEPEEIHFRGHGGERVQMFLVHPPGATKGRRRPLIHLMHGGPHGIFGDQWHWRWNSQLFAASGWVAAMVNFHGSTSWGQEFAQCIQGRWGDQPYVDIMAATDELVSRGIADPSRMAVAGGSYGGYLAAWIASQTDRFACVVNHAGVADLQSEYASDVTEGRDRSMGGELWDNVEGMDRYNPARHAKGFRSPMLVIHGEKDYRVPYQQALEVYNIYRAMGLPARLILYPDENHWILKPKNSILWYDEVASWVRRWFTEATRRKRAGGKRRKGTRRR